MTFSNDGMTISNDNRNCNIQYNDNNVKFQAPNDIKTLAHKPYGLGIRYFEHHQQHILVKFQAPKFYEQHINAWIRY